MVHHQKTKDKRGVAYTHRQTAPSILQYHQPPTDHHQKTTRRGVHAPIKGSAIPVDIKCAVL